MALRWLMAAFLLVSGPPAWAGDITGSVVITSKVPPRPSAKDSAATKRKIVKKGDSRYPDQNALLKAIGEGEGGDAEIDEIGCVVVHLLQNDGKTLPSKPPEKAAYMDQKDKNFIPHVLPVVAGTTVRFQNGDRIFHHIFSVSQPGGFEIDKHINHRDLKFSNAHPFELFCGIHPRMNAYVYVVDNNFFTVPDAKGRFKIKDVPAGTYTLRAWHPRLKAVDQKIVVPASGQVEGSFEL